MDIIVNSVLTLKCLLKSNRKRLKCHLYNGVTGCFSSWGGRNDALSLFPCLHVKEGPVQMVWVDRLLQRASPLATVWTAETTAAATPIATGPVAVGDAHHDEEEDKAEEDEPGDDVHDRRRDRDGDRGLHLLSPYQKERQSQRCKIQWQCAPAHSSRKTKLLILAPLDSSNSSPSPRPCQGFFNWCLIRLALFPNL